MLIQDKSFSIKFLVILCFLLTLTACASKGGKAIPGVTNKPYTVRGETYHPLISAKGFNEVGMASWYGPGFHGKKTSSGERYNQNAYTAAHKLLPFGTMVVVTNLDNGRKVKVRITDRGPFHKGRVIDLSRVAANEIGLIASGTARVRITPIGENAPQSSVQLAKAPSKPIKTQQVQNAVTKNVQQNADKFFLQLAVFAAKKSADNAAQVLQHLGLPGRIITNNNSYIVQVGPYPSYNDAQMRIALLKSRFPEVAVVN